jgi:hypothetical protein
LEADDIGAARSFFDGRDERRDRDPGVEGPGGDVDDPDLVLGSL